MQALAILILIMSLIVSLASKVMDIFKKYLEEGKILTNILKEKSSTDEMVKSPVISIICSGCILETGK